MSNRHILLLTSLLFVATGTAVAASSADTSGGFALVSPAYDTSQSFASANLSYQTGAYFYGNDCGGNSPMTSPSASTGGPGGVILSGAAGREVANTLNCDDRRNALASYRDAFQGTIGQPYPWRNPNGGATGNIIATSRHQDGDLSCTKFHAVATVDQIVSGSNGTACRERDGNWHTQ